MLRALTLLLLMPINTFAKKDIKIDQPIAAGITIEEVQRIMEESTSYLIYGDAKGVLVNKDEFFEFDINYNDIHKSIDLIKKENISFSKNPFAHKPEAFDKEMMKLYNQLIKPVESKIEESLNIIPSTLLLKVPWNALKKSEKLYLIDEHDITIKQDISKPQALNKRKIRTLVFAPKFTGGAYLNNQLEKEIITKRFKETKNEISKYEIIHVSSHGRIDSNDWLNSGVYLDNKKVLSNKEIINMCIDARLVFLNICNGAKTNTKGQSIAQAFEEAGAKTIIAAQWEIEDQSAIQISKYFYDKIASGEQPSKALKNAIRNYKNEVELTSELNPFYWAGYQVYGENSAIIGEITYNFRRIISLILSFLTSFSILGYYFGGKIKGKLIEFNLV